ncbi:MAG: dienelactone hydrolase family protein [Myxococcales bacterium]|nr:alpha/beta hydrolase [Myxococcales bacterium]HIK85686.1 alpha/beta hydrolase [Myxococcales bacterium]
MKFSQSKTNKGVTERDFSVTCQDRTIPGVLWTPEARSEPTPLVLIGHGGSGHKREDHLVSLARRFVRHNGISAVTIDGPFHGDRASDEVKNESVNKTLRRLNGEDIVDKMVEDWKATLDALQKLPEIGIARVGYWGLSMGTMFGVPLVAAEPRIEVAVLGLMGPIGGFDRLIRDAPNVTCPLLFLQQWDDELIPREKSCELFDAIGGRDRRLHSNPGPHSAVPQEEFFNTQAFLARHLSPASD